MTSDVMPTRLVSVAIASFITGACAHRPAIADQAPIAKAAPIEKAELPAAEIDLAGFVAFEPVVAEVDGRAWLGLASGNEPAQVLLSQVASAPAGARCAQHPIGATWSFPSEPPMRLHLGLDGVGLEAFVPAADCWQDVEPEPTLKPVGTVKAKGSARAALVVSLDKVGLKGVRLMLESNAIALFDKAPGKAVEPFVAEDLDAVWLSDWEPESADDYEGQVFESTRAVSVELLRDAAGVAHTLVVAADEVADGDPGDIGGSRHYVRKLVWRVRLGEHPGTALLDTTVSGEFSGDGVNGTDYGARRVVARRLAGGAVRGEWAHASNMPFGNEASWTFENDDGVYEAIGLPLVETLDLGAERTGPRLAAELAPGLSLQLAPDALVIERAGKPPQRVPLLAGAPTPSDIVELASGPAGRAFLVDAWAERLNDPPTLEDERGIVHRNVDRQRLRLLISRTTPQVLAFDDDRPALLR